MRYIGLATFGVVALGIGGLSLARPNFSLEAAETPVAATGAANAGSTLQRVTLKVENMNCAACPVIVRRSLENIVGVESAKLSYRDKTAVVTFDPAKCTVKDLLTVTAHNGFPSTVVR